MAFFHRRGSRQHHALVLAVSAAVALLASVLAVGGVKLAAGADGDDAVVPSMASTTCIQNGTSLSRYRLTLEQVDHNAPHLSQSTWRYRIAVFAGSAADGCGAANKQITSVNAARDRLEWLGLNVCGDDMGTRLLDARITSSPESVAPTSHGDFYGSMFSTTSALFSNQIVLVLDKDFAATPNGSSGVVTFNGQTVQVSVAGPDCGPVESPTPTPTPSTRTIRIISQAAGGSAGTSFAGTIAPFTPGAWSVEADGTLDIADVPAAEQTVVEGPLSAGWSLGGYSVRGGLLSDCSSATYSGTPESGVTVPADGDQTVCIKNTYTPPTPVTVSLSTWHTFKGDIGGDVPVDGVFNWTIAATVTNGPSTEPILFSAVLPPGIDLTGMNSLPQAMECTADANSVPARVRCTISPRALDGVYRFTVGVRAPGATPSSNCADYENAVTGTNGSAVLEPASDTVRVTGCAAATVSLSKTDDVDHRVDAGAGFNWTVTLTVAGGPTGRDYALVDAIPTGFSLGVITMGGTGVGTIVCPDPTGGTVACTLRSGAGIGTYVITIPVIAPPADAAGACAEYTNVAVLHTTGIGDVSASDVVEVEHCSHKVTVVARMADGDSDGTVFTGTIDGSAAFDSLTVSTSGDVHARVFDVVASQSHSIEETPVPNGYALDGYRVIAGSDPATCFEQSVVLAGLTSSAEVPGDGDYVVCMVNHAIPDVSLAKTNDVGGDINPGGAFHWTLRATVANGPTRSAAAISDVLPVGFVVTPGSHITYGGSGTPDSASCSVASTSVECVIEKGAASGTYDFTLSVMAPVDLGLCGEHINTATIADTAGDGELRGQQTYAVPSASDAIRITCGGLVIRAKGTGGDASASFSAGIDDEPADVVFGPGAPSLRQVLAAGAHTATSRAHEGYAYRGWAIGDEGGCPEQPTGTTPLATVSIADQETAYLCFYNEAVGTIVIKKTDQTTANGGTRPEQWDFTVTAPNGFSRGASIPLGGGTVTFEDVPLGTGYSVTEAAAHFDACPVPNSGGTYATSVVGGSNTQDLSVAGETLTFEFINQDCAVVLSTGTLVVSSVSDLNGNGARDLGEIGIEDWNVTISGPEFPDGVTLRTNASGQIVLPGIETGVYTVDEETRDGYRSVGLTRSTAMVSYSNETAVEFLVQPLVSIRARQVELTNGGLRAGSGWKVAIEGCGVSMSAVTDGDGVADFTELRLCPNYTVTEETDSKPGFAAMGASMHIVAATGPGETYEVTFRNSNVTVCTSCSAAGVSTPTPTKTVVAPGDSTPASAPSRTPTGAPSSTTTVLPTISGTESPNVLETPGPSSATPIDIVLAARTPGVSQTPIAPETGSGAFAGSARPFFPPARVLALLMLCGGIALVFAGRARRL